MKLRLQILLLKLWMLPLFLTVPRFFLTAASISQLRHEPVKIRFGKNSSPDAHWTVPSFHRKENSNLGVDIAQQCASDLLAVLGGQQAAASVNQSRARELLSSIRFLTPFRSTWEFPYLDQQPGYDECFPEFQVQAENVRNVSQRVLEKLIHWPPAAVADLAKSTVEWGGDPSVIFHALGNISYQVPDVEGIRDDKCQLTKYEYGQRFVKADINKYVAFLFHAITVLAPSVGLNVSLSRYDLFHGHMFTAYDTGRLGILFHAREYPSYDEKKFPVNLGFCQTGSNVPYDDTMGLRNLVWLAPMPNCSSQTCSHEWLAPGSLFILDTKVGGVLNRELIPEWLDIVHTVSEDDFGTVVIDVNYFTLPNELPETRVFMC